MRTTFPRGSEWRKWDLHVHTPASDGTGTPEEIVAKAVAENLSVIAITDHHSVAFIDEVKNAAKGKPLTVLSGVEFRSEYGSKSVHFIAYFPERCKTTALNAQSIHDLILAPLGISRTAVVAKGRENDASLSDDEAFKQGMFLIQVDFKQAAKLVHQYGGLISVHNGNKSNGLDTEVKHMGSSPRNAHSLYESLGTLKEELLRNYIDICDVGKEEDVNFYLNTFNKPSILASDAHNVMDIGSKFTWIKADPTFNGLRQILFEPEERVKIQADMPEQKAIYQTLKNVSLNENGFWKQTLPLNPGLVAIVGGRSSGKSNLLTAIAWKAGYSDLLDCDVGEESTSHSFLKEHLPAVNVAWSDGVESPKKLVEYFPQGYMINLAEHTEKIEPVIWGILKGISENQRSKEDFDRKINELKSIIASECSNLFNQRDLLRELDDEIKEKGGIESHELEVARLKDEMAKLKKQHMNMTEDELREFESLQECERSLNTKKQEAEEGLASLTILESLQLSEFFPHVDLPLFSTDIQEKIKTKIQEIQKQGYALWQELIVDVKEILQAQQNDCIQQLDALQHKELYKRGSKHILDNVQLNEFEQRIKRESSMLADIKKIVDRRKDVEARNCTTIDSLARHHYELYSCSRTFAEAVRLVKNGLSITGVVTVERDALARFIDGRITRISKEQKEWYEKILAHDSFTEGIAKEFLCQTMKSAVKYNKDVDEKTVVLELLSTCWFHVTYDVMYQNDRFYEMSPGKRSFVVLQLLLEFSDKKCPILIDQPEDNLDNRSIYNELVMYLRKKKKERQIILITHNPNIVVGADAEQVIVANQHGKDSVNSDDVRFAYVSGSLEASWPKAVTHGPVLESQGIREHVCEILEGGEDAFRKRESKYGFLHE